MAIKDHSVASVDLDHDAASGSALEPFGLWQTAVIFGGAGLLLFAVTQSLIPAMAERTTIEPIYLWFLCAGIGLFGPLLVVTLLILHAEGALRRPGLWRERLRFRPMDKDDWAWSLGALVTIAILAAICVRVITFLSGARPDLHPSFLRFEPLGPGRYGVLVAWIPFFIVNILGEEILWRGVLLPRQEVAMGRRAWLIHGAGWLLLHVSFGPTILLVLAPTTFILPYVAQRRRNSWTGVVIHGGLNGPAFLAIAFGLS